MKKRRSKAGRAGKALSSAQFADFTRGFVASGLLSALQDRNAGKGRRIDARRTLRHAVQGGIALAAGSTAASALGRQDYLSAAAAALGGAAGVVIIEEWLRPSEPALIEEK